MYDNPDQVLRALNGEPHESLSELENEQFNCITRVHDWRNYIPDSVVGMWHRLGLEAKYVAYLVAERVASNEEWD